MKKNYIFLRLFKAPFLYSSYPLAILQLKRIFVYFSLSLVFSFCTMVPEIIAQDTDLDGIDDIEDLDDDNDGIPDSEECGITMLSSTPAPDGIEDNDYPIGYWDAEDG